MTTAIEYALMAGASYISTRAETNQIPAPKGWAKLTTPDSYFRDQDSGFEAISFTNGTEVVISFAGTAELNDYTYANFPWLALAGAALIFVGAPELAAGFDISLLQCRQS